MAEVNKKQLTPFEKEQIETAKIIVEYKQNCEANIVSIIYKTGICVVISDSPIFS